MKDRHTPSTRIATLDVISNGRVEFGTGTSNSQMELGGFGVSRDLKHAQWEEALDAITRLFVERSFAGYEGRLMVMPPRNLVPRPVQNPHPPLWMACSRREAIVEAAQRGIGALSFSFIEPEAAREWVDAYYTALQSEQCVPAGFAVNPTAAVVVPLLCHEHEQTAIDRGIDGAHFFGHSLAYYYFFGQHRPGHTSLWEDFQANRRSHGFTREAITATDAPLTITVLQETIGSLRGAIGTPAQITDLIARYEQAGVDQVIFAVQAGHTRHEHICESLELFARAVMPRFAAEADAREAAKRDFLAAACERALARRAPAREAPDDYVVTSQGEGQSFHLPHQEQRG